MPASQPSPFSFSPHHPLGRDRPRRQRHIRYVPRRYHYLWHECLLRTRDVMAHQLISHHLNAAGLMAPYSRHPPMEERLKGLEAALPGTSLFLTI